MINAIILAAGESKRMGRIKPLLRFKNNSFLEQIISQLRLSGVDMITVVLGAEAEKIKRTIDLSEVNVVVNEDYQKGQLSSLIAGLNNTPGDAEAILLCLVDNPFITKEVVIEIIDKFEETNSPVVVPVFNNKRGHPALFSKALFNDLLNAPEDEGAKYVVHSNKENTLEFDTGEKGILVGINTPGDYKKYFGFEPESL